MRNFLKNSIFIGFFFSCWFISASVGPIKVTLNETNSITLFFPSEIATVIEPSHDFHFSYDKQSNMGVLKAKKGKDLSNLTVTTNDGNIFSFVLQYAKEVNHFVFVLTPEQAIGKMHGSSTKAIHSKEDTISIPLTKLKKIEENSTVLENSNIPIVENNVLDFNEKPMAVLEPELDLYRSDPETYYEVFCENTYLQKPTIKKVARKTGVIELKINHVASDKNEMYITLQLTNGSLKSYPINDLQFYIKTRGGSEELSLTPLYEFNTKNVLKPNSSFSSVYVFKNFKLSENQHVYIILNGFDGNRFLMLPLTNKIING
ncbi:DUF4138 domain-containing protein [uncultured Maribacter sp.]|uniref:DUF4138 domain-containing protein n=1 Tax=uncultured Maribacter sp. TaxID=431308 RepID=UPI00262AB676|nr:DUF4138 domain-containing protein [uncultured Maribacter sp.]